ncbi:aspartyl-phosphate phosphatase Spo0E family protein [Robertmurraya massiliosenegalensis]|uniref:aspartyl-phosphate phosphatase Spo0E family protein n=1 Tax=Robertmurraya massiliosenegalensis TaxID=1287657 RepID=UPI00031A583A|nr:aspartyl-phosphate phosphatase Spo0E family protein [Robertmurraya massiliosenegalensis]
MKIENNKRELFKDIEMLRTKMVISGHRKGLLNSETIKFSQQLDQLIYKQQCLKK